MFIESANTKIDANAFADCSALRVINTSTEADVARFQEIHKEAKNRFPKDVRFRVLPELKS